MSVRVGLFFQLFLKFCSSNFSWNSDLFPLPPLPHHVLCLPLPHLFFIPSHPYSISLLRTYYVSFPFPSWSFVPRILCKCNHLQTLIASTLILFPLAPVAPTSPPSGYLAGLTQGTHDSLMSWASECGLHESWNFLIMLFLSPCLPFLRSSLFLLQCFFSSLFSFTAFPCNFFFVFLGLRLFLIIPRKVCREVFSVVSCSLDAFFLTCQSGRVWTHCVLILGQSVAWVLCCWRWSAGRQAGKQAGREERERGRD